jgi:Family of unknown function (DUF6982)
VDPTKKQIEPIKVVARYRKGILLKGFTHDFFANKGSFHITLADRPQEQPIEVMINRLKGVYMVRDFDGDPGYVERKEYSKDDTPYGVALEITFEDGEVMVGSSMGFDPRRDGFFVTPADPMSNNLRVFVVTSAVKRIRQLHIKSGMYFEVPIPGRKR